MLAVLSSNNSKSYLSVESHTENQGNAVENIEKAVRDLSREVQ